MIFARPVMNAVPLVVPSMAGATLLSFSRNLRNFRGWRSAHLPAEPGSLRMTPLRERRPRSDRSTPSSPRRGGRGGGGYVDRALFRGAALCRIEGSARSTRTGLCRDPARRRSARQWARGDGGPWRGDRLSPPPSTDRRTDRRRSRRMRRGARPASRRTGSASGSRPPTSIRPRPPRSSGARRSTCGSTG